MKLVGLTIADLSFKQQEVQGTHLLRRSLNLGIMLKPLGTVPLTRPFH